MYTFKELIQFVSDIPKSVQYYLRYCANNEQKITLWKTAIEHDNNVLSLFITSPEYNDYIHYYNDMLNSFWNYICDIRFSNYISPDFGIRYVPEKYKTLENYTKLLNKYTYAIDIVPTNIRNNIEFCKSILLFEFIKNNNINFYVRLSDIDSCKKQILYLIPDNIIYDINFWKSLLPDITGDLKMTFINIFDIIFTEHYGEFNEYIREFYLYVIKQVPSFISCISYKYNLNKFPEIWNYVFNDTEILDKYLKYITQLYRCIICDDGIIQCNMKIFIHLVKYCSSILNSYVKNIRVFTDEQKKLIHQILEVITVNHEFTEINCIIDKCNPKYIIDKNYFSIFKNIMSRSFTVQSHFCMGLVLNSPYSNILVDVSEVICNYI